MSNTQTEIEKLNMLNRLIHERDQLREALAILEPFIEIWAKGGADYKERMDKYWGYDNLHKAKAAITKANT
jgi:hypothetical protein